MVEIVTQLFGELLSGEPLRLVEAVLGDPLPVVPPVQHRLEVLQFHGLCLGEMLVALRHVQPVKPGFLGRVSIVKEQNVGGDGGIGREHTAWQTDNGVQVKLSQQFLLDVHLGVVGAEQEAIGQDHRCPTIALQSVHDDRHEQVSGLTAGKVVWEVIFHIGLFAAAIGRIHQHHIELVVLGIVQHISRQGIVVVNAGDIQPVQQQIIAPQINDAQT